MKIMLDTNVLISALVFGGKPREAISQLVSEGHDIYVSTYVDQEFRDIVHLKWPRQEAELMELYEKMCFIHCGSTDERLGNLRDEKDIPVLSDALYYGMDILLTGDKDFLEADIDSPLLLSPALLLEYLKTNSLSRYSAGLPMKPTAMIHDTLFFSFSMCLIFKMHFLSALFVL